MTFASKLTRTPRVFEPERGAEIQAEFSDQPPEIKELLMGAGGSSPYLHGLLLREADWLRVALHQDPDNVLDTTTSELRACGLPQLKKALRQCKRKVALYTGLADLGGVWNLQQVTTALTDFADLSVEVALKALVGQQIDRGKLPGLGANDMEDAGGYIALAMGKMGAHELNYSSDIDLICLFDETRFEPDDYAEARAGFVRATRNMTAMLSDLTEDGYVFRTDLRLRPDPSVTPVCLAAEAAERYYESLGRTWERAAFIKARACAGDLVAGQAFLDRLSPFVWRRHLDFAAIDDAHNMRLRIREHKGLLQKITLEGHNMKLGSGGIREIEFFTQTRQIIAGGRDADLRLRETLPALAALARKGWVPEDVAQDLSAAYVAHRDVEHRLQMVADAQTHSLPQTPAGFARLAALMGQDADALRRDLTQRLEMVAQITEGFFAPKTPLPEAQKAEFDPAMTEIVDRWQNYPALRSARAVEIFDRLRPDLLARMNKAAKPLEALNEFDRFLAGLPAGVQLFSLFEANPQLVDLMVDIAATAPGLARFLGRNSAVLDAVIGGGFFEEWPGLDSLGRDIGQLLRGQTDYESKLDAARRWQKEWHFRIGVHFLRRLIGGKEARRQYAELAQAIVAALFPVVTEEFARKHGAAPGRGAAVVAMGSMGAGALSAASDLDLILIYDAQGQEASQGRRPLATTAYYARLTQSLVTALQAPTAAGRLYEVDMRLRPSGRQGPVATSLGAFENYQKSEAWTWEHLALTRARAIAGPPEVQQDVMRICADVIGQKHDVPSVLADVADMRARLASAKPSTSALDVKSGPGRMMDMELFAQTASLLSGAQIADTMLQMQKAQELGWVSAQEVTELVASYALLADVQSVLRLLDTDAQDLNELSAGARDLMLRTAGASDMQALQEAIQAGVEKAATLVEKTIGAGAQIAQDGDKADGPGDDVE